MKDHDKRLTSVLSILRDWDPIGVGPDSADDEYRRYAIKIVRKLDQGCDAYHLTEWLGNVRTNGMGLEPNPNADQAIALRLVVLRK